MDLAAKLIPVKINIDKDKKTTEAYKISGIPDILFMDAKGKTFYRMDSPGGPDEFAAEMQKALKKAGK